MERDFFCIADNPENYHECFMRGLKKRNPNEKEFHQACDEIAKSILPFLFDNPKYLEEKVLERITEPDRIISFKVNWEDDNGNIRTNRGYRVQFNNSIGPYKGGLRFHPSVNQSILKFLGFEQIFKNSLTSLPIGGAKGGSDFNPKGRSDREIMRFCQAFMIGLHRHIGEDVDVPAGDIGVGSREISYLFGQYKKLENKFTGALTGKSIEYGGSPVRTEATGYGLIYFTKNILEHRSEGLKDKACLVSGAGNVAQYATKKLIANDAKVLTMSDSRGTLYCENGFTGDLLDKVIKIKSDGGSLSEIDDSTVEYLEGKKPWAIAADYAFPCATQNEIELEDVKELIGNNCKGVFEGANMPVVTEGIDLLQEKKILYAPGKAANAGGVAISAIEMSQNNVGLSWTRERVDTKLQEIMKSIHDSCVEYGSDGDFVDYQKGANIAGFKKVADAMISFGI